MLCTLQINLANFKTGPLLPQFQDQGLYHKSMGELVNQASLTSKIKVGKMRSLLFHYPAIFTS